VPQKNIGQMAIKMPDRRKFRLVGHGSQERLAADSVNLEKITHDIRSSINIIIGYTQLMLDQTTGKINAQQRQALQDILKSTNRLSDLTDIITRRLDAVSPKKQ
jgi:signal transduction histidine kinase